MKTNLIKTYLLIAIVISVWGTIGYKIINSISSDELYPIENTFNTNFKPKTIEVSKSFTIDILNRDPFLGTFGVKPSRNKSQKRIAKPKTKIPMPIVQYTGLIKKQNTKDQVFVVSINNQQYLLKKGQTVDGITLIRGNSKEIVINHQSKTQTIKRD